MIPQEQSDLEALGHKVDYGYGITLFILPVPEFTGAGWVSHFVRFSPEGFAYFAEGEAAELFARALRAARSAGGE